MYDVYVPFENFTNYSCISFDNTGNVINAFYELPVEGQSYQVDRVYVNNHYNIVSSNIVADSVNCISFDKLTNNWTYRNDLPDVLICLFFFMLFFFGIPLFIFSRLFKKKII